MKLKARLACSVALCALLAATGNALTADFTVQSGQTVNTTQTLADPGDVGLIEAGGTISTAGLGVLMGNIDQSVINEGDITTSGNLAYGIWSQGADAQIANSGDITTSGNFAFGIYSQGADAQVDNSDGITTSGAGAYGIYSTGDNAQVDNSGDITTSGTDAYGIASEGADAQIANSGDITTSGATAYGIYSTGDNATVTNSGRVISEQSFALLFGGSNATLNLLAGSAIQGGIGFGSPGTATLNIGPRLNTALTFTGLPGTINSYGAPMLVQGSLVAVVDPTGFSAQDEMLTDLTRAISGTVDARLAAARFGYAPMTSSVMAYVEPDAMEFGSGGLAAGYSGEFWATGIGSYRNQDADGVDVGFDSGLGGLMVGYDGEMSGGTRVGGFLGASASSFGTDANSQQIDADSYFGGLYAGLSGASYFLDLSVTGGVSRQSSDRAVANNLVIGGIEHATADYGGVFISPSATIGTTFATEDGGTLIPSLRARYAGLFLDGYEESGSAANLSVDDRDVNVVDFRAQLAYALAAMPVDDGSLLAAFRIGADATLADNEDVETTLLGEALNFSVSGDDTVRGFAGVDMSYRTDGGTTYFLGAEAGYDSGDAFTLDVRGGLHMPL